MGLRINLEKSLFSKCSFIECRAQICSAPLMGGSDNCGYFCGKQLTGSNVKCNFILGLIFNVFLTFDRSVGI